MSLEQALQDNTAALVRVAELLEVSNAERAKLLASANASSSAPSGGSNDDGLTVAEIKDKAKSADGATLAKMLADEKDGKNRSSAVKAIEDAIAAGSSEGKVEESAAGGAESASTEESQAASPSPAPTPSAATDKNAQPVPAEVTGEQAAGAFGAWFGETDDEGERAKRRAFVEQIVGTLGAKISELDLDGRRKAIFFLRRQRAGMSVDFAAAYDFNGSPTQEVAAAAEAPAAAPADDLL